jgi:hypothetical protein
MDISIIIVNWNSVDYLREALLSIKKERQNIELEVVVVDNASHDGCADMLDTEFPEVIFVQSKNNKGFAGANNLGFQHSSGNALLFLNPDTEIIGPAISTMYTSLCLLDAAGAVGCRLLNSDLSLQTSCIQAFPAILNQIFNIEYLRLLFPKAKFWGLRPLFVDSGCPEPVDVISGACLMIKRDVFEKVHLFSTDYFMYSEDVDLCYKINKAGYRAYYTNEARVIHHGGGSSSQKGENHFGTVLMNESRFKFFLKTRGKTYAWLYKFSMALASLGRLSALLLLSPLIFTSKKSIISHATKKWQKILRWSLGLEKWCKDLHYCTD